MANFGICRGQKIKGSLGGIRSHMNRESESRTNPDIDPERTPDNYSLEKGAEHLQKRVNARIKELKLKKAPRKDAVKLVDFVVTASPESMQAMSAEQQKKYFEQGLAFLKDFYGKENFMYCEVHMDEETPHAHVGFVPITKDGRLCAKEVTSRKELGRLQDEFYEKVSKEFGLERGEKHDESKSAKRKHIETSRLKAETAEKRASAAQEQEKKSVAHTEEIKKRMKLARRDIEHLEKIQSRVTFKKKLLSSEERVEMSVSDYRSLQTMIERAIKSTTTFFELKKVADESEERAKKVEMSLADEKATSAKLLKENAKLQKANNGFALIPKHFQAYVNQGIESDKRNIKQAMHDYNKACAVAMIVCNGDVEKTKNFLGKDFSSRLVGTKIQQDKYLKACAASLAKQVVLGEEPVKKSNDNDWAFPHPSKTDYKEPISKNSSLVLDALLGEKVYGINECGPTLADMTSNDMEKFKEWPYLSEATRSKLEKESYLKEVRI